MGTIRQGAIAAALLIAMLATGCAAQAIAPDDPSPRSATTKPSTPSPTPATPTPALPPQRPSRLPPVGDLVVTPVGIGSLLVGKSVLDTDMVRFDPEHCAAEIAIGYPYWTGDPEKWVANYPDTVEGSQLFGVWMEGDTVFSIEVSDPTLRTSKGIGVGSSVDELVAAYPSLILGEEGHYSKTLVFVTGSGEIVFEVMTRDLGGSGDRFTPGNLVKMRIFPPGSASTSLTAGSDDSYLFC